MINLLPEEERNKIPRPAPDTAAPVSPLHQPEPKSPLAASENPPAKLAPQKPVVPASPPVRSPSAPVVPIVTPPLPTPAAAKVSPAPPAEIKPAAKPPAPTPVPASAPAFKRPIEKIESPAPVKSARGIFHLADKNEIKDVATLNKNIGVGVNLIPEEILGQARSKDHLLAVAGMATGTIAVIGILFLILVAVEIRAVSQLSSVVVETQKVTEQVGALDAVRFEAKQLGSLARAVKTIVNDHVVWTPFFSWVEKNTLPEVTYRTLNADMGGVVTMQIEAGALDVLLRQYRIFRQNPRVKTVELKDFTTSFAESGATKAVTAALRLGLDPGLFHINAQVETSSQPIKLRRE